MSMQPIVMKIALFRGDWDQARSQYSLLWCMEALVRINQSHIRQFRKLAQMGKVPAPYPPIYRSGVHYEPEAGTEEWLDIPNIISVSGGTFKGPWGDCEDLACWRTAELREDLHNPMKAKPFAKWRRKPDGSYAYHALTLLPNGSLEDPSLVLGMANEPEFAKLQLAQKYKEGTVAPKVQYAKLPDVVVVDPEKPSGFSKDIKGAQRLTGLDQPPPGAKITGLASGRMPSGHGYGPRIDGTSNEDGSAMHGDIATSQDEAIRQQMLRRRMRADDVAADMAMSGDDVAAWGYDRASVDVNDMRQLANMQRRMRGANPNTMMGDGRQRRRFFNP